MDLRRTTIATLLAIGLPATASADVVYDYLEGGVVHLSASYSPTESGTGYDVVGSYAYSEHWALLGQYQRISVSPGSFAIRSARAEADYHAPISRYVDGLAGISYGVYDDNGPHDANFGFLLGMRGQTSDRFELDGWLRYSAVDSVRSSDILIGVSGTYSITERYGFTVGYEQGHVDALTFNFRYTF